MLKNIKVFISKAIIEKQKNIICKYINRFNKINMCFCLQIIIKITNYFICFENYIVGY